METKQNSKDHLRPTFIRIRPYSTTAWRY